MTTKKDTSLTSDPDAAVRNVLANLKAQATSLQASIATLEKRLGRANPLAAGSAPVEEEIPEAPKVMTLRDKISLALTRESLNVEQLAKAINEPVDRIKTEINNLRAARPEPLVFNVGMGEAPIYTWRIGDGTDTPTLRSIIVRLIQERPMTTRELADATGARMSRVEGVIVELRRAEGINILDLGVGHAGRWLITDSSVKDPRIARLAKRKRPKEIRPRNSNNS